MSSANFCLTFSKMTQSLNVQQPMMTDLKPHAQAHLLSPTNKCKICLEPAARHVHYGAMTCFSCRAFFRRSLQSNTSAKYRCMRQSMCEMNIKTRKNCQYCRYMKCLDAGMNPNYVLSEDQRKLRFKKRRNSLNEEEQIPVVVPVIMSVTVKNPFEDLEAKEMTDDKEMMTTGYCSQFFLKKEENTIPHASDAISSPENNPVPNAERKYEKNSSQQNSTYFPPNIPAPSQSAPGVTNQNRNSIITKNSASHPKTENSLSSNINTEYKNTVINEHNEMKNEEQNLPLTLFQCPKFSDFLANQNLNVISEKRYSCDEQILFKEIKKDPESEIETNSESGDEITQRIVLSHEPEIIFTEDEKYQLDKLIADHDTIYHSVNFGEVLIKEMLMCSMFGVAMSTSAAIQGYRLQVERITRVANSLKCFTNLQKVDQITLLKENADLLVSLRGAIFFDKKKKGVDQVMSSMGIEDMETIKKMFKPLIQTHTMNHIDYKVFNSIQDPAAKKTEERYSFLQGKVADAILDNITTILMTYIILFSSDFCSLEDKKKVEKTQHHYLRILERCLYSASDRLKACTKMAHMLNAVTCVREMADIKKSRVINHSACAQISS